MIELLEILSYKLLSILYFLIYCYDYSKNNNFINLER